MEARAGGQLVPVERPGIVLSERPQRGMRGGEGLDDHLTLGQGGQACQHLIRALRGPEVGQVEARVRADRAHHGGRDLPDALHEELRADEEPAAFAELLPDALLRGLVGGRCGIKAVDGRAAEQPACGLLHTLRADPVRAELRPPTGATDLGGRLTCGAEVAVQPDLPDVIGHRDAAPGAARHPATLVAEQEVGVPSPRDEQDRAVTGQHAQQRLIEPPAEQTAKRPGLRPDIGERHRRPLGGVHDRGRLTVDHRAHHLGRRNGRPPDEGRSRPRRPFLRHAPGVVARCAFFLIGGVLLVIDDDESQTRQRGEDRGARADHDPDL